MVIDNNPFTTVPLEIAEYAYNNNFVKPFAIYLYLKLFAADKVNINNEVFTRLRYDLKMADSKDRTFNKHWSKLLELNWVGFNKSKGLVHVRSYDYIRATNGFKMRRASRVELKDILQLQIYIAGALICDNVLDQQYYWEFAKGRKRTATQKDVAKQPRSSRAPKYYGISKRRIGRLLSCKSTRATVLKNKAEKAGYLKIHHRYLDLTVLEKADYRLRPFLALKHPRIAQRVRFWSKTENDKHVIKVVQQLHDELIPLIQFKRVCAFSALKVSDIVRRIYLSNLCDEKTA